MQQRWGTYSVKDHIQEFPFAADVLMFDKLVIPRPANGLKRADWDSNGWQPVLLDEILAILGEDPYKGKAIVVNWTDYTSSMLKSRIETVDIVSKEANFNATRMLLEDLIRPIIPGEDNAQIFAAYNSIEDVEQEWPENNENTKYRKLTAALCQKLLYPSPANRPWQDVLKEAIALSQDSDFKRKRECMYRWQRDVIHSGLPISIAVEEMADYVNEYNKTIKQNVEKVYQKFAFTLIPISVAAASGSFGIAASITAISSLLQFYVFDRQPISPGYISPGAAMFHTAQQKLNWRTL